MQSYTRVYAPIDLDAIEFNMQSMQRHLGKGVGMLGVVKADGYGHGAVPVAKTIAPYVEGYATATPEEAVQLCRHGITKPVMILGAMHPDAYPALLPYGIRPSVFTLEQALPLSALAVKEHMTVKFHLPVDTGMGRIGVSADAAGADLAAQIAALPGLELEGLFTHFAKADETDKAHARGQMKKYADFVQLLRARGVEVPVKHISNSAAIIDLPEAHYRLTRAGISIYGMYPSDEVDKSQLALKPAMGLKSFVTYVKTVPAGTTVSYGGLFTAQQETRVATIPVGYADGYPRALSNRGDVLINGRRARILGRVCMDQFMADVTDIPDVKAGTPVTLIGRDGDEEITVEELAGKSGGFHYELVCLIGKRVPRVYLRGGKTVGTKDYFDDTYEDFR